MLLRKSRRGYHNRSKKIMGFQRMHAATGVLFATLVSGAVFAGPVKAQSNSQPPATGSGLWDRQINSAAVPADAWFENYKFRSGETLERLKIHYATLGTPRRNTNGDIENAVLVLHWTGADSRVLLSPSFTRAFFDADRPLDANRYYLIFPDSVGHGQSSRPSEGLRAKFPNYDYSDIVDLQHKLVTEILGVKRLRAILGISMGGMNAWQWAEAYPNMMDGVMPVVSLPTKVSGRNLLWRRMVIDAIRSDPEWRNGEYTQPPLGWILGYGVMRLMIDSASNLQTTIPDGPAADNFIAASRVSAERVDANDILYSLKSSFTYHPEPDLAKIKTKLFALNFSDDEFNPDKLQVLQNIVPKLERGRYLIQEGTPTSPGHLTMTRPELWAPHVAEFMKWLDDRADPASK